MDACQGAGKSGTEPPRIMNGRAPFYGLTPFSLPMDLLLGDILRTPSKALLGLAAVMSLALFMACGPPKPSPARRAQTPRFADGTAIGVSPAEADVRRLQLAMGRAQEDRELSKTEHETIHALIRLVPEDFADSAAEITNALSRQGSPYRLTPQDLFDLAGLMLGQRPSLSPDLVTRTGAQTHGHVTFV